MMNTQAAVLTAEMGGDVVLQHVNVVAHIEDLVSKVDVEQIYKNNEHVNIEAVYTFPLPIDSVLLSLSVEIGERTLEGVVVEKNKAETEYEDAITDGHTVIMLEQVEPGLYTMNVGNLNAGETATIRFSYGALNKWKGDQLRFFLPMTLATRYGDPIQAGLAPHQVPGSNLFVENKFSLTMTIAGALAHAEITCPSHNVAIRHQSDTAHVSLEDELDFMDKDFVVLLKPQHLQSSMALSCQDGESQFVMASFNPVFESESNTAQSINIVVDCSGSMTGISIQQAKKALEMILDSLNNDDYFNIIAFGSSTKSLFKNQRLASPESINQARQFVRKLDADMGGTEMLNALKVAYSSRCEVADRQKNLLLITDGEIWDSAGVIREAIQSESRIFTVGVGVAVSEAFLSELAEKTEGASEFVSPNEGMADNILRHYQRIQTPQAENIAVQWDGALERQYPATLKTVFSGDTIHLFGWFKKSTGQNVSLVFSCNNAQHEFTAPIRSLETDNHISSDLPRLAMNFAMKECESSEAEQLALQYQLVSPWTNYLMVDKQVEGEKPDSLPEFRQVPHMRTIYENNAIQDLSLDAISVDYDMPTVEIQMDSNNGTENKTSNDYFDIPAFLRREIDDTNGKNIAKIINHLSIEDILALSTLDDLETLFGKIDVIKKLRLLLTNNKTETPFDARPDSVHAVFDPEDEQAIVFGYLYEIKTQYKEELKRDQKRAIDKGYKLYSLTNANIEQIKVIIEQYV